MATSRPMIFEKGFDGTLLNPEAFKQIVKKERMTFVQDERIAEMVYMAVYMPLVLETGERYVLSIPYFTKGEELNKDIFLIVIVAVNIAMIIMVLAFILSSVVAERITKPLQVVDVYKRQKYVRAGIEEWNKAFERIGFKNVLRVVPFPETSDFDAGNIQHSVIRYSPTSPNMYRPQQSMLVDSRSGEILNASLYLHHHFLFILQMCIRDSD